MAKSYTKRAILMIKIILLLLISGAVDWERLFLSSASLFDFWLSDLITELDLESQGGYERVDCKHFFSYQMILLMNKRTCSPETESRGKASMFPKIICAGSNCRPPVCQPVHLHNSEPLGTQLSFICASKVRYVLPQNSSRCHKGTQVPVDTVCWR